MTVNAIPSPVVANGILYCMSGYTGSAAVALPLGITGDVTNESELATIWRKHSAGTPLCGGHRYSSTTRTVFLTKVLEPDA